MERGLSECHVVLLTHRLISNFEYLWELLAASETKEFNVFESG